MKNFAFPIQLRAYLFALLNLFPRLLYSLRYVVGCACAVSIGVDIRYAHCRWLVPPVRWLLVICVCFPSISYASSPPANNEFFCLPLDYEAIRARDSLYAATKQALDLDVGEPRTVRMIYFLPNDRPFQQEVVDLMKVTIRQVQTFYADQMEAHGYGRKTFRFETDAQGEPLVHRVNGQHADSHYLQITNHKVLEEIERRFNLHANIYYIVIDNSMDWIDVSGSSARGVGVDRSKKGGFLLVSEKFQRALVAHELGHAFGLYHDFRDAAYTMSYGPGQNQLSECAAEFLAVHTYFNLGSPIEEGSVPTIRLLSPRTYPAGTTSVSVQIEVADPEGIHQVILLVEVEGEVKACRGLAGKKVGVVEFDYDGVIPSEAFSSLYDPVVHTMRVVAVDADGNVKRRQFGLSEYSPQLIASLDHEFSVTSLAFSPEGTLATGSLRKVELWDVRTRERIATLVVHPHWVSSVAFSRDGNTLASSVQELNTVKLWDVATQTEVATLKGHADHVPSVAFSPDGTLLASGSWDGTVKLWDVATRENTATLEGHANFVFSVAFSPDGTLLASGSWDGTVKLWDVATRENTATLEGHTVGAKSVMFSPDGSLLASGTVTGPIMLWDVATRENTATLEGHTSDVQSVVFSPDGTLLASASADKSVKLWYVGAGTHIVTFKGHTHWVGSVAFSPDGTLLASASADKSVKLWDIVQYIDKNYPLTFVKNSGDNQQGAPGSLLANLLMVEVRDKNGAGIEDIPVTFTVTTGDGKLSGRFTVENTTTDANGRAQSTLTLGPIAGTNTVEVSVAGFDPVTFNAVGVGTPAIPIMGGDYQTWHLPDGAIVRLGRGVIDGIGKALAFSPDGQLFAVASAIGIWLYDVATWREIELLTGHSRSVEAVAFSPDGTMLASGARDGTVKLWDVATQTHIATLWGHNGGVGSVSFSPSGKILASGSWQEVKLWDVETQTNIATLAGYSSQVLSLAFSPDGTTLAVSEAEGDEVKLWDVATRENIATFAEEGEVGGSIYSIAFSPDGTILASMYKNAITLWNVARKEKMTVFLHKDNVISLAFSPDGATIAGASRESVELWDIATGQNTATIKAYRVRSMVFAPNSTMLALGSLFDVTLYDIATKNATILSEYLMWVDSMDFSPDGTILASGYPDYIKLWDVATGQNIFTIDENNALFGGLVAFSPNGKIFAIESKRDIILWDVATRTTIATLKGHRNSLLSLSFSPDGTTLASGGYDRTVKIWDIKTQSNVTTFKGHTEAVYSVAFSPDGTTLASGAQDETIKLWDVGTRRNIATLTGHTRSVNSVSFSPDGTLLASGSDPEVVLWDVATRTEVATFEGHTGSVKSVAFSPDGKELVSGSRDGTILLWDMSQYVTPTSAPTPDFDGDGIVGISDFLLFVDQFGFSQEDVGYDARFDLDGDGVIGVSDFLIFVDNFGKKVS